MENELYLKILQDFPALIWRAGTDGLCDYFNSTWLEFTGKTLEQEQGNGWAEGVHPEDLDRCIATYREHFDRRQPFNMEYRLLHKSGEYRWILDMGRPFHGLDESFLGYIGSCYDITSQKQQTQELLALGEFRDRIFSIIGHDLRNMMGNIRAFGTLIQEELEAGHPENCREYPGLVSVTADGCLHLLSNLLDWGSSQSGKRLVNPEQVDLCRLSGETLDLFSTACSIKGLKVRRSFDSQKPPVVTTDPEYLKTILRNLVSNAMKFTPRGGEIEVTVDSVLRDKELVARIQVRDSGSGMPAGVLEQVRAGLNVKSMRGTEGEGGSGLGLSLCSSFARALGIRIHTDSAPGAGTVFLLEFPPVPAV